MSWALSIVVLGIAAVILGLWLHGGGVTAVHDVAGAFISVGRLTGLLGAYLLLIQVLLVARLPFLEWIAGFDKLTRWHRVNGKACLYLILAHVATITIGYAMTDRLSIPAEFSVLLTQYPGMIAALVGTVLVILVAVSSIVIVRRRVRYEAWYLVHLASYLGIFLAWFHQIPTGNEFITSPAAAVFWTALYVATLQFVVLFRLAQPVARALWHDMRVAEVIHEGPEVVSLRITGRHLHWLNARAGQFFQWRFLTRHAWWESHPFSLSAAPDGTSFRITVKNLGDFSGTINEIRPGTRVVAEGPFGSFTNAARSRDRVALIAGGIGITPIRALLEEMSGDIVLVYRMARQEDAIFRHELDTLARECGVTVHYVVGHHRAPENQHLLSAAHLRRLIPNIASRDVYLCGPEGMMQAVEDTLRSMGVPERFIHSDRFALA